MEVSFRLLGFELFALRIGSSSEVELVEVAAAGLASEQAFGFAPDPLFVPIYWEDDDG